MSYAIIAIGGKQFRVREGERLLVDRLREDEGATLTPTVLLVGGDGDTDLSPDGTVVTARVVEHVLGDKIRIGKYKPKKGYRRHAGFRARLSRIEISEIGAKGRARKAAPAREAEPKPEARATVTEAAAVPAEYEGMTVAQINEAAAGWDLAALRAALAYERDHAARKGAIAALESAISAKESD
jgi:large subunit ribosomal protein L21